MRRWLIRPLRTAFGFLTRLPVGGGPVAEGELGRAVGFFPLVGLVLGLSLAALGHGLRGVCPPTLAAVVLVAALVAFTGALHLDGLADLFDGLGGGRGERARTLEIMRDSRIGAQGAVALMLVLAAKIAALSTLLEARDTLSVVAFPLIARWVVVPVIAFFPYARAEGLGRAFQGEAGVAQMLIATATMAAATVGLGAAVVKPAGAALAVGLLLAAWLRARLGGLTGDVYGAIIEIAETVALAVAALGLA